ncbi:MAG TPA: bifunctional DNA primase/polymerase, partial [Acidimicrobiia bacterium]
MNPAAHDAALQIAETGLRVIPIKPGSKHPPIAGWQKHATTDTDTIDAWWSGQYADHGIGIVLGTQPDGRHIFAVDIDRHAPDADGHDTLAALEAANSQLPVTVTSHTGADGKHLLYEAPPGLIVKNQRADGGTLGPGIDIRGENGQIVVAPTIHPNGNAYQWATGLAPWEHHIAAAPAWLIELVRERDRPTPATPPMMPTNSLHPADLLRERWDWPHELAKAGWTHSHTASNGDEHWTRPGKDPRDGTSAVLHPGGPFVIFTTEISPALKQLATQTRDGTGWSVTPFNFYAATYHNGDTGAAARALDGQQANLSSLIGTPAAPIAEVNPDDLLLSQIVHWPSFYADDHTAEDWLVQPIIANGRSHAIFAPGGTGKSLLSLWLAVQISSGGTVFGNPIPPRTVLYLDYEMTAADLADRLDSMGVYEPGALVNLKYALLPALASADTPEGGRDINRLAELVNADVVVLDTFSRAVEGDENEADTVRAFYRWTGIHLKAAGRAFIRIDHAGKDLSKGQRGTSAKNDDVDVVWQISRTDQGIKLTAKKRRMGWVPETVDLIMREDPLEYDMANRPGYPAGTKEAMDLIAELGIDHELPVAQQGRMLREAGHKVSNQVLRAAIRAIRQKLELTLGTEQSAGRNLLGTRSAAVAPDSKRHALAAPRENGDYAGQTSGRHDSGRSWHDSGVQSGTRRSIRAARA